MLARCRRSGSALYVLELIKRQSCHHIETSQLICSANQMTGFYMMATLAFNELNKKAKQLSMKVRFVPNF